MALTHNEINKILELRGKRNSYRKIYDKTGHSENTSRKVIQEAEGRVITLNGQGLVAEQIAKQLGYPVVFVSGVIDRIGKTEPEVMAEIGTEGPLTKQGFMADWEEFRKKHAIEIAQEELRGRVNELMEDLSETERQLDNEGVAGIDLRKRNRIIRGELEDFALPKIAEIQTEKDQSDIDGIIKELEKRVLSLEGDLKHRIQEAKAIHRRRQKEKSDQLLSQEIDIPLFPEFVREQVKERFLVEDDRGASIVCDALTQISLLIMKTGEKNPWESIEMWQTFMGMVGAGGWSYLMQMAENYRRDTERLLISINVCPQCNAKLTRTRTEDGVIIKCPSCGRSYSILNE